MEGRKAFLASVGAVVLMLGVLVLFAVPAARHMDAKALDQRGNDARQGRGTQVVVAGCAGVGLGGALVLWGLFLRPKS